MSPTTKSVLAAIAAFICAPFAYLFLAAALDSVVTALGAYVSSNSNIPESQRYSGTFTLLLVVFPLLAILGALTTLAFTLPPATFVAWKKTIFVIAIIIFLPLVAVVPTLIGSNWRPRVIPESAPMYWLAYVIILVSSSLPAVWALALALWCKRQ